MTEVADEGIRIWGILSSKLRTWLEDAIAILPNIIVALTVMFAFHIVSKFVARFVERLLMKTTQNLAISKLIATTVRLLILAFGLFTALGILNLEKTVGSLLAGAGVIGLAVGFAFQEIAANFFSGILIALRRPFAPGDIVQVDSFFGVVEELTLRTTNVKTPEGHLVLIPNRDMFTKPVTNFTTTPDRRLEIEVGVSYSDDLKKVEEVTKKALQNIPGRKADRPIEFYYKAFGQSSIDFSVFIWIEYPDGNYFYITRHEAILAIKEAFDRERITIPFPIRTLEWPAGQRLPS